MKRMLCMLLALALVFSLLGTVAFAYEGHDPSYYKAVSAVSATNCAISAAVKLAQATPYNDVLCLIISTEALAASCKSYVRSLGYDVRCEYETFIVDGISVRIDPLHVIVPPGGEKK
ncbi:MAG: hypothetical protein MJ067_06395 [Oscillospiraceae bacterium]|nr:hypothetical protein [Oscillospiraceae bacterium]